MYSFSALLATAVGSVSLLILIASSVLFIVATSILVKYRAKITRDASQEQESTNRADYEEIELNLQSERAVISIATKDNVAYEHIPPKNMTESDVTQ